MKIKIIKSKPKAFVICPVRNIDKDFKLALESWMKKNEDYYEIYYPARDTEQNDPSGFYICSANRDAMRKAKIVFVAWDGKSYGSHFDLGMAFAMGKKICAIPELFPEKTKGKSFRNMIAYWSGFDKKQDDWFDYSW